MLLYKRNSEIVEKHIHYLHCPGYDPDNEHGQMIVITKQIPRKQHFQYFIAGICLPLLTSLRLQQRNRFSVLTDIHVCIWFHIISLVWQSLHIITVCVTGFKVCAHRAGCPYHWWTSSIMTRSIHCLRGGGGGGGGVICNTPFIISHLYCHIL